MEVYIWSFNVQTCLLCDEPSATQLPVCGPCKHELPWLQNPCQCCALPLSMPGLTCGGCLKHPPAFAGVHAPWRYDFPVDSLILRFKHNSRWPFGRLLAALLSQSLLDSYQQAQPRPDVLLPVPLSTARQCQRGYNQCAMLGQWLSDQLDIPCQAHWLLRTQDTPAQQALDAKTRKRNLLNAFALAPDAQVRGLHLALVDDVLTTGATAQSLAPCCCSRPGRNGWMCTAWRARPNRTPGLTTPQQVGTLPSPLPNESIDMHLPTLLTQHIVRRPQRIALLQHIAEQGSITRAAKSAGISYKAAWEAIDELNNLAQTPLVERSVGGKGGGGARLSVAGERVLRLYQRLQVLQSQVLDAAEDAQRP
jgi:ComF family protein